MNPDDDDDDETVYRMSVEMRPIKEMAEALGVSIARVYRLRGKLFSKGILKPQHRQDMASRQLTPQEDRVRILTEQGMRVPDIAADVGLPCKRVSYIRHKLRAAGELPPKNPMAQSVLDRQGITAGFPRHAVAKLGSAEFARWLATQNARGDTLADTLVKIAFAQWQKEKPRP